MAIDNRLAGQVALVTGGSRGIGAEIVRRLAAEGADVGFTYHTGKDEAEQVAGQVRGLGRRVLAVRADLAEPAAAPAVVDAVLGEFGRVDVLVNNAGITHWGSLAQTSVEGLRPAGRRQRPRSVPDDAGGGRQARRRRAGGEHIPPASRARRWPGSRSTRA